VGSNQPNMRTYGERDTYHWVGMEKGKRLGKYSLYMRNYAYTYIYTYDGQAIDMMGS
jgi:predicted RecB family nuclease